MSSIVGHYPPKSMWNGLQGKILQPIKEKEVINQLKRLAGALNTNIVLIDEIAKEVFYLTCYIILGNTNILGK